MKLIIAGSTGNLGTGLIRHALSNPSVTTLIALGRREILPPTKLPPTADVSKFKSVALKDFENYDDDVKEQLSAADAVIWTIAITPSKVKTIGWEESCKISRDYALKGIETISQLPRGNATKPLKFVYLSGSNAERDQSKRPWLLTDYALMRGDAETKILAYAAQSNGVVEGFVAKVGLISDPLKDNFIKIAGMSVVCNAIGVGTVDIDVISAALLDQVLNGFEKETLFNADVVRIGTNVLEEKR